MFKLLSKESNIFSIPLYFILFLILLFVFNHFPTQPIWYWNTAVTVLGIGLGYFVINKIRLCDASQLPFFIYSLLAFALFPKLVELGIGLTLVIVALIMFTMLNPDENLRNKTYVLVGFLVVILYIFFPKSWMLLVFFLIYIIVISTGFISNIIKYIFGIFLGLMLLASIWFVAGYNFEYFFQIPCISSSFNENFYPQILLLPIFLFLLYSFFVYFSNFNKTKTDTKYKYNLLFAYFIAQLFCVFVYMGNSQEYLLLLLLPASAFIGKGLMSIPYYWQQELGLWLMICTIVLYKIGTFHYIF